MGVFPEPALCADDVSRLVPNETFDADQTVAWLPRTERRTRRTFATLRRRTLATLVAGALLGGALPQNALAPAAAAHDRIDERALTAQTLVREQSAPAPRSTQRVRLGRGSRGRAGARDAVADRERPRLPRPEPRRLRRRAPALRRHGRAARDRRHHPAGRHGNRRRSRST